MPSWVCMEYRGCSSSPSPTESLHALLWPEVDHAHTLPPSAMPRLAGQSQLEPSPGAKNRSFPLSYREDNAAQHRFLRREMWVLFLGVEGDQRLGSHQLLTIWPYWSWVRSDLDIVCSENRTTNKEFILIPEWRVYENTVYWIPESF